MCFQDCFLYYDQFKLFAIILKKICCKIMRSRTKAIMEKTCLYFPFGFISVPTRIIEIEGE